MSRSESRICSLLRVHLQQTIVGLAVACSKKCSQMTHDAMWAPANMIRLVVGAASSLLDGIRIDIPMIRFTSSRRNWVQPRVGKCFDRVGTHSLIRSSNSVDTHSDARTHGEWSRAMSPHTSIVAMSGSS